MKRHSIRQLLSRASEGRAVTVFGWARTCRASKKRAFIKISDGSTTDDLQIMIESSTTDFSKVTHITTGTAVACEGIMVASFGQEQDWEVHARGLSIIGESTADYPLQKKNHSYEFLREISHFRGRSRTFGAVFRLRNQVSMLIHQFFQERDFLWVHTPILTASDCEGAGEVFSVTAGDGQSFFGKPAYLTVSGQLNGEALALSLGQIYTFGPTFRAENSNTTRHLAEFWMVEPEVAFAELSDLTILAEEFLRFIFQGLVRNGVDDLEFLSEKLETNRLADLERWSQQPFVRISYTHAIEELQRAKVAFEFAPKWGADLQTEHERFLTEQVAGAPVVVTDYPKAIKSFYMRENEDEETVAAMDVLLPKIGELIGGSQREDRVELLRKRMGELNVPLDHLTWYLELRRFGGCPHAGFGLGLERLVQYVTGMPNIRDVIPFPRTPGNLSF